MSERKWVLEAYPAGQPRIVKEEGGYRSTAVFGRDYAALQSAYRAAVQVHRRFPDARLEIQPFTWRGYWSGDKSDAEVVYFCPCGGRLVWSADDMAYCTRCGDEWPTETVTGKEA